MPTLNREKLLKEIKELVEFTSFYSQVSGGDSTPYVNTNAAWHSGAIAGQNEVYTLLAECIERGDYDLKEEEDN
jgi:hypothetical protein